MGSVNSWRRTIFLSPPSIQGSALHINNSIIVIESDNISIQNPTCPTSSSESKFGFFVDNLVSIINSVPKTVSTYISLWFHIDANIENIMHMNTIYSNNIFIIP